MISKLIIVIQEKCVGFAVNCNMKIAHNGSWLNGVTFLGKSAFYELDPNITAALNVANCWLDYNCILVKVTPRGICLIQCESNPELDKFTDHYYNISPDDAYRRIEEAYSICCVHAS